MTGAGGQQVAHTSKSAVSAIDRVIYTDTADGVCRCRFYGHWLGGKTIKIYCCKSCGTPPPLSREGREGDAVTAHHGCTRVLRTTPEGTVMLEFYGDLTAPPLMWKNMTPDEADKFADALRQQAQHARGVTR